MSKVHRDRWSRVAVEGHGEAGAEAELGLCGGRLGASARIFPQQGQECELRCRSMGVVATSLEAYVGAFVADARKHAVYISGKQCRKAASSVGL